MLLVTFFLNTIVFYSYLDVRPVAAARPVELVVSPRPGGHVNIVFGDYPTLNSLYIDGASDYEAI